MRTDRKKGAGGLIAYIRADLSVGPLRRARYTWVARPKPRLIEYRNMKKFDHAKFLSDLKNAPWQSAYSYDNTEDV